MSEMLDLDFDDDHKIDELEETFNVAANQLQKLVNDLQQTVLLEFYGLYKQSTVGQCNTPKPGMFSLQAKAKWNAWSELGKMTKKDAMNAYVQKLTQILPNWNDKAIGSCNKKEQWVSVSCPQTEDSDIVADGDKTIFDYVKENDFTNVCASLQNLANLNERDDADMGLVHWAADRGKVEILSALLKHGLDVNLQDGDGQTALHYSVTCRHIECVRVLLEYGADRTIEDNEGQTCLDVSDSDKISTLLKS